MFPEYKVNNNKKHKYTRKDLYIIQKHLKFHEKIQKSYNIHLNALFFQKYFG